MTITADRPEVEEGSTLVPIPPAEGGGPQEGVRPRWLSQHVGTALICAAIGYAIGHWFGNYISSDYIYIANSGSNSVADFLALAFGVVGWLAGIGSLNYPAAKLIGREAKPQVTVDHWSKFVRFSMDHKVVGLQYIVGVLLFLFTGGLLAMAIRTELLNPTTHVFGPGTYIEIVSEHGTIMMMMASSLVVGPLGNYFVPLMIGARRTAFPRIEAFSFWVFMAGYGVIVSALPYGGFPTGWTGYAPLQTQAGVGMISYLFGFAVIGVGMMAAGFNILVTIIHYRAPGMTWSRIPIFVWSILSTAALLTLATPVLFAAGMYGVLDKTVQTAFYVSEHGGSSYLWQNLFWFFGHPEVYIMALPGFGIVGELMPVFTRKPLFAYKVSAAGMIGVALLSFFVWQHHLFQSGIDPDMRPLFMLTTELISIPTGFLFLVAMGTLYKAKIRFEVPMLFVMAVFFNFLIGGLTGVFLSDVPVDVTVHGGFFVLSHFHYTIMGGLVFAFMAGVYYWMPKMTGKMMNKKLGLAHFWTMFVFFNLTFFPMFIIGLLGQPRRVFTYAKNLQGLNDFSSVSAFLLGLSFLIFLFNVFYSMWINPVKAPSNPWDSLGLEWQTASPIPPHNFDRIPVIISDPYHYSEEGAPPFADFGDDLLEPVSGSAPASTTASANEE
jgi:cytochrome c oxidase subunit 1